MSYVDPIVAPVPVENLDAYRKLARQAAKIWVEHGALHYQEAIAEDVPEGKTTDFFRSVKRKEGETVSVAWIIYKSRRRRDDVMAKVMADPRMKMDPENVPFGARRMFRGGFQSFVERRADG